MNSKPSISGMPRSTISDVAAAPPRCRSSAAAGDGNVVTSAPAVSSTTRSSASASCFVVDGQHADAAEVAERRQRRAALGARMLAPHLDAPRGCTIISGSRTRNVAPWSSPALAASHGAAVHLDDVADDRQPEPEAAGLARRAGLRLAEPLEHVGQEVGRMPMPVSLTDDFDVRVDALQPDLDAARLRRELDGVGQQVPHAPAAGDRDRPTPDRRRGSTMVWMRTPLASAAGCTVATALSMTSGRSHRLHVQPDLARDDARDVEHVLDDLGQPVGVALEGLEAARRLVAGEHAAAQQPRVADDRVQRRAQLVRQHREELVLHAVGVAALRRAAARSRARPPPTRRCLRQSARAAPVNTPTRELPKNRPPRTSPCMPRTGTAR